MKRYLLILAVIALGQTAWAQFSSGSDIIVTGEGELQVFDVMGRMVATQYINGIQTINTPQTGVYIFRLNGKTQKIVVK
jgi:hypothetical protein